MSSLHNDASSHLPLHKSRDLTCPLQPPVSAPCKPSHLGLLRSLSAVSLCYSLSTSLSDSLFCFRCPLVCQESQGRTFKFHGDWDREWDSKNREETVWRKMKWVKLGQQLCVGTSTAGSLCELCDKYECSACNIFVHIYDAFPWPKLQTWPSTTSLRTF